MSSEGVIIDVRQTSVTRYAALTETNGIENPDTLAIWTSSVTPIMKIVKAYRTSQIHDVFNGHIYTSAELETISISR